MCVCVRLQRTTKIDPPGSRTTTELELNPSGQRTIWHVIVYELEPSHGGVACGEMPCRERVIFHVRRSRTYQHHRIEVAKPEPTINGFGGDGTSLNPCTTKHATSRRDEHPTRGERCIMVCFCKRHPHFWQETKTGEMLMSSNSKRHSSSHTTSMMVGQPVVAASIQA